MYVKFNVHSSYVKQVIVLKVADRRTDAPGDNKRHPPKFWLRPKNCSTSVYTEYFSIVRVMHLLPKEVTHF